MSRKNDVKGQPEDIVALAEQADQLKRDLEEVAARARSLIEDSAAPPVSSVEAAMLDDLLKLEERLELDSDEDEEEGQEEKEHDQEEEQEEVLEQEKELEQNWLVYCEEQQFGRAVLENEPD